MADPSDGWYFAIVSYDRRGLINPKTKPKMSFSQAAQVLLNLFPLVNPNARSISPAYDAFILKLVRRVFCEPFNVVIEKVRPSWPPDPDFDIPPLMPIWL